MLLGPIFRVELVSVARRRRYFVLRVLYALVILFVLWTTYSSAYYLRTGQPSIRASAMMAAAFFVSFSWLQVLSILLVGPAMAAGTIATERERRTIEYLFATDLSNTEIVLGKTVARLTLLGQFILVGLPILFLFRLMGGIPAEALLATFLSAAGTAIMVTSLSIAISVWSPKARDAVGRVYALLLAMLSLPPILMGLQASRIMPPWLWETIGQPLNSWLLMLNPMSVLMNAMGNISAVGVGLDLSMVLKAVANQLLVAVVSLALAVFAVRRAHLSETTRTAEKLSKQPKESTRRPPGEYPMIWKEMYTKTSATRMGKIGCFAMALILISVFAGMLWVFVESITAQDSSRRNNYFQFLLGITGYLGTGMLLLLGARSAGLIAQERERDTWISLVSTPLTAKEIILGKLCGNLYSARWMLIILIISWMLGILIDPSAILPMIGTCLIFVLLSCFTSCLGLLFSLRSQTSLRAMGQTLGTLIFVGGGYLFCCCTVMAGGGGGGGETWALILAVCIPFLLIYPNLAFVMSDNSMNREAPIFMISFIIGIACYGIATYAIYKHLVTDFDQHAGRTKSHPDGLPLLQSTTNMTA